MTRAGDGRVVWGRGPAWFLAFAHARRIRTKPNMEPFQIGPARFEVHGRWQLRIFILSIDRANVFGFSRPQPDS